MKSRNQREGKYAAHFEGKHYRFGCFPSMNFANISSSPPPRNLPRAWIVDFATIDYGKRKDFKFKPLKITSGSGWILNNPIPPMDECLAHRILSKNFTEDRGFINLKNGVSMDSITSAEYAAIDHLCDEWDYCFGKKP
jgi:hypothetical protein